MELYRKVLACTARKLRLENKSGRRELRGESANSGLAENDG